MDVSESDGKSSVTLCVICISCRALLLIGDGRRRFFVYANKRLRSTGYGTFPEFLPDPAKNVPCLSGLMADMRRVTATISCCLAVYVITKQRGNLWYEYC
jgi:hypothetical protein